MFKNSEYYRILRKYGLSENATYEEISRIRRKKLKESHPDLNKDKPNATKIFQEINSDTNFLLLVWEKEQFKYILDQNKKGHTKKIVALSEEYDNLLYRVRSLEELHRIKSDYERKLNKLFDTQIFDEIEKVKLEIEKLKNKYSFEEVQSYCSKAIKTLSYIKNINELNKFKINYFKEINSILKKYLIEDLIKTRVHYNDQEITKLCNHYINLFTNAKPETDLDKLYDAYKYDLKIELVSYNIKLESIKRDFKVKLEKNKRKYSFSEITTLCDNYQRKILSIETINNLNNIISEYEYAITVLLKEKFKRDLHEKKQKYANDSEINTLYSRYSNFIQTVQTFSELEDLYDDYKAEIINILKRKKERIEKAKANFKIEIETKQTENEILKQVCKDTLNELKNIQTLESLEELKEKYLKNSIIILKAELIKEIEIAKNMFVDEEVSNLCDETLSLLETIPDGEFINFRKKYTEKLMSILQEKFPSKLRSIEFETEKKEFYFRVLKDKEKYEKLFSGFYDILLMTLERIENIEDLDSLKQYYDSFLNAITKTFKKVLEANNSRNLYDSDTIYKNYNSDLIDIKDQNLIYNNININNINNINKFLKK